MITVLGASGFIGSHLVTRLQQQEITHSAPGRGENLTGMNLGDVIYCIGLTADFRARPLDTVQAHVCHLLEVIRFCKFDSLLYLSSTRLYHRGKSPAQEEDALQVTPSDPSDLYNISKAMGEALVHSCERKVRIARISNVYGGNFFSSDNFLNSIIRAALSENKVVLHTALDSEKDYVYIDDVIDVLLKIATRGTRAVYNVASGTNVTNHELMDTIRRLTGCAVEATSDAETIKFPHISIERIMSEFSFAPSPMLQNLKGVIGLYERHLENKKNDEY